MNDIKTVLYFKANSQFSLSYKNDVIAVYGEITKESLSDFVRMNFMEIKEMLENEEI